MPYPTLADLPPAVQKLPKHGQQIFQAAFNAAFEQYGGDEEKCFAVAWAAVETKYKKAGEDWVKKSSDFEFSCGIDRVWKSEEGKLLFEGVASTTAVDSQKERMSEKAIERMVAHPPLDLVDAHANRRAGQELGVTLKHIADGGTFKIIGEFFDDNPDAIRVWKRMSEGKRYGLSVGGKVVGAHWEVTKGVGERVRVIDDLELNHIAITPPGGQANPDCWLSAMAKSVEGEFTDEVEVEGEALVDDLDKAFDEAVDALAKAGARHSRKDVAALHTAMQTLQEACGCESCAAALAAISEAASADSGAVEKEAETAMSKEAEVQEETAAVTEEATAAKEEITEEVVKSEEATPPPDIEAIIAKAVEAGRKAEGDEQAEKVKALEDTLAKQTEELNLLKATPVGGGPEGKPSGEPEKTEEVAKAEEDTLVKQFLNAGDKDGAGKALAAKVLFGVD